MRKNIEQDGIPLQKYGEKIQQKGRSNNMCDKYGSPAEKHQGKWGSFTEVENMGILH